MRKTFFVILSLLWLVMSNAQPDTLQQLIDKANEYYKQAKYDSAIALYGEVLNSGWTAPELYYNLGNAYYRRGLLAKAILNYERAYRLDPSNEKIKHNLEFARQFIQDDFSRVNEFFLKRWWRGLALMFRADVWAYVSVAFFAVALLLLFVFFFARTVSWRKTGFFVSLIAFFFAILTFSLSLSNKHYVLNSGEAIVLQPTSVRSSPSIDGTELYLLHEGVKVKVLSTNDGWYEVKLPNGSIGWLPKSDVEKI